MDTYEATNMVMSRIQGLDPENVKKIMGYILIQDLGEKELIRLAHGPDTLLISLMNQAKTCMGLSSNTSSTPSTPSSPSPFNLMSKPGRPSPFPQSSPRIIIPNNGFHMNPSSPSSPWSGSSFSDHLRSPRPPSSLSYAAVVNGTSNSSNSVGSSSSPSFALPFFSNSSAITDLDNEYNSSQIQDHQLPFLDDSSSKNVDFMDPIMSPSGRSDSFLFPYGNNAANWVESGDCVDSHRQQLHRRSCSVSDMFLGGGVGAEDGGGFGWRPCMYFARGFCKNGNTCKFLHGGFADSPDGSGIIVGSPSKVDRFDELLRLKAIQQQRFAAASQLMAAGPHPFPYNKCMNFLSENQRSVAAALTMGDEFHKFGRCRPDRSDFMTMGLAGSANSSSRQIYLTFPADSTFKEEDVSNYFSMYGPVQDVRIPYQQKRMFGFVTFVYPETVKIILAKGNPHFVCDSRVLVKPYKEKGKITDKKQDQQQQQQMDRGEFSACLSPSGLDSREPFDMPFGARMFYNSQEIMFRRKLEEQAELQQAIDLQGRRLMNFQLMDLKNQHHNPQFQPNLSQSVPISSLTRSHSQISHGLVLPADGANQEVLEVTENNGIPDSATFSTAATEQKTPQDANKACNNCNADDSDTGKTESCHPEDSDFHESLEDILPDNLFASPTKSAANQSSIFSIASEAEGDDPMTTTSSSPDNVPILPTSPTLGITSLKSCFFQPSRSPTGQEAIEM